MMLDRFDARKMQWIALLLLIALLGKGAVAQAGPQTSGDLGVTETRLPNGLVVLTKEDHAAPVVCTYVWYRVGSRNEVPGLTGISHQLEHMMFKGTKHEFPHPGYIDLLVGQHGGENNAFTTTDYTAYFLLLPADQLDLALRIEADRMTQAAMDPKQLVAEKRVVLSELEGDNNDNSSFLYDNTRATAYQYHPYHYPIIGTKWDVEHFTRAQVYHYYRTHYAPNNATLVIVGDFDTTATLSRVRQLWRDVQPTAVPQARLNPEPPQRGERHILVRRAGTTAYLECMYHIPAATHPDLPSLTVLASALAEGRSSRLYRALVETQLASDVGATANQGIDSELLDIEVSAQAGVMPDRIETALLAALARLRTESLTDRELQQAKNQARADFIYAQDSVEQQAARLGLYQTVTGDWRTLTTYLDKINAVTAADVRRVAQTYLTDDNRTVGVFQPNGEPVPPNADTGGPNRAAHYRPMQALGVGRWELGALFSYTSRPTPYTLDWELGTRLGPRSLLSSEERARKGEGPGMRVKAYTQRPTPNAQRPHFPNTQLRRLPNGLTVLVREDHANPTVEIAGFVRDGSVNDPAGKFGLADLVAEMLTRGTTTRTSQQIAEATDFVGASLDLTAGRERTDLSAKMLAGDFETVLGLMADCLQHPTFPADELEKARGEVLTTLQQEADDTAAVATQRLYEALYPPEDPYRHEPEGQAEDVRSITRDDVLTFYRHAYRPEATTLVIVGDIHADAAFAAVEKAFGGWQGEGDAFPTFTPMPVPAASAPAAPIVVTLADKDQGDVAMGLIGLTRGSRDYEAAMLMNLILGGDEFVGRVGKRVRDTEGLAYYAYTQFVPQLDAGPWMFRAGVNPKNIQRALASAQEEIAKMARSGVTDAELAWAKDHSIGALRLSLATDQGIAAQLVADMFYGLRTDYAERAPQIIRSITKAQVDAAARKYLRPGALTVVIAGPPLPAARAGRKP
jgi:zinc protease